MKKPRKGFVLVMVLIFLLMVLLGVAAILSSSTGNAKLKDQSVQVLESQYFSGSAMQWAIWNCRTNPLTGCQNGAGGAPIPIPAASVPRPAGVTNAQVNWVSVGKFKVLIDYADR